MLGVGRILAALAASTFLIGCREDVDTDRGIRAKWLLELNEDAGVGLRAVLNGTAEVDYYDGWYPLEYDPKTNGAWRWMGQRGILQLRTKPGGARQARDMELHVFGWVPMESVGFRTCHLEFSLNGHVLGRFEPTSPKLFEHTLFVPRWLLEKADWVDFVITTANTARPAGEWRDLGFATTGFIWKEAGSR
jgi:hypothetical protein